MNAETSSPMNKTQINMNSTLTPVGGTLRRGEVSGMSRSSKYRYANTNKAFNPEIANISSSINKQYRAQTRIGLPGIRREKGFMLEEWLNDALQGDQGSGLKEPLRTLKKYQMDKGSLRNANLSTQQINNLYNGLFVYTSGIKNAFEDMFKFASLQNRDDNKTEKTYWKIFIKLLENTIPVKTCFQIFEDDYRREIANLKRAVIQEHKKAEAMQEDYEGQLRKLRRQIEELDKKGAQFQQQFKVMNSNLILYEESFNEQVFLRLKFEQKINQVYTSYDELKEKFEAVRQQLNAKTKHLLQTLEEKRRLQNRIADEVIKNEYLIQKHELAQSRLAERQSQIAIKNQQITDIMQENHNVEEKKKLEEIALDQLIVTIKLLKKSQIEHDKKINELKAVIEVNEKTINNLKENLLNARQKNDDIFLKYHESILKGRELEDSKTKLAIQLQETKAKILMVQNQLCLVQNSKDQLISKTSNLQVQMSIKNKEISDKNQVIRIFDISISQLKAIKDRYQRQNQLLKGELSATKAQLQKKIKEVGEQRSKSFEHKHQLQKYVKAINDHQITIQHLKKTIQKQEMQIRDQNNFLKGKLDEANLKTKEVERQINQQKKTLSKVNETLCKKDYQKLSTIEEITFLKKKNAIIEKQLLQKKERITELLQQQERKNIEIDNLKKKIQSKQFTLNQKREQVDGEIINLKLSLSKYKKMSEQRKTYVNPMICEDLRSRVVELASKLQQIRGQDNELIEQ